MKKNDELVLKMKKLTFRTKLLLIATGAAILAVIVGIALFLLFWNGILLFNGFAATKYEVHGVDLSHYPGEVNWQVLAKEDIDFAFLKATEGSDYVDANFAENLTGALHTDLRVGAYHFFSFSSAGATQAENFIAHVPTDADLLPPVVDLELYGSFLENPLRRDKVQAELNTLLAKLESAYGKKPILYVTETSYDLYIAGDYSDYDIWFREVITRPKLSDDRAWTFWQYSNRGRLKGYEGEERYIDLNVFYGTREEFEQYGR